MDKAQTFLLLAASSACLTKAVPSAVTCCIRGHRLFKKTKDKENVCYTTENLLTQEIKGSIESYKPA